MTMTKLILVRHGETDWNKERKVQGHTDIELNANGFKQAQNVAKMINLDEIDLCLCSSLKRAKQTAETIVNGKIPIYYTDLLKERCLGDYEGTQFKPEIIPKMWDYHLNDNSNNIESVKELLKRADKVLELIKKEYPNKNILIVSHGGFIKALHYSIIGYNENTDFLDFYVKNTEIKEYII